MNADPQSGKKIQKEIGQRLEIYSKQFHLVQAEFPDSDVWQLHEAAFYTFQAGKKVFGSGFLSKPAQRATA